VSESPIVSVIVPCRNENSHIEACVRSILAQESPAGGFEVIVADGMSDDGTRVILERLKAEDSRLRVIDNAGRIVSCGLNAAIQAAQGKIIIRMDAHTKYARDYIRQSVQVLEETGADKVGGPWVAKGEGFISRAVAAAFQSPFAAGGARGHDSAYEGAVDLVYLGCWRREVFDRVGLFDEGLVRNQDDEFDFRLKLRAEASGNRLAFKARTLRAVHWANFSSNTCNMVTGNFESCRSTRCRRRCATWCRDFSSCYYLRCRLPLSSGLMQL